MRQDVSARLNLVAQSVIRMASSDRMSRALLLPVKPEITQVNSEKQASMRSCQASRRCAALFERTIFH